MTKALFINGSPRKNWNTHKLLESAMKGADDSGAECELVHLYDFAFKGCISCFACKLKAAKRNGLCAYRDALTPVLEKALDSDVIVMGTPIYYSMPTGMMRSFTERLLFPIMTYSRDDSGNIIRNVDKKIFTGTIFTMNAPESEISRIGYDSMIELHSRPFKMIFGYTENLCSYETLQFKDYSRYEVNMFDGNQRHERNEKVFPEDLKKAYELGVRLVNKAKVGE